MTANEFAHSLGHPDIIGKLRLFIADQTHTNSDSNMSLTDSSDNQPPQFDDLITLYPSAVVTYFAPSDLSGIGGMHSERIRATPNWRKELAMIPSLSTPTQTRMACMVWMLHVSSNSFHSDRKSVV